MATQTSTGATFPLGLTDGGTGGIDAATARTALGLEIGTNVQAQDVELSALASLTSAADKVPYFTGAGTAAVTDLTAFGRSIIDDVSEAAFKATVNLEIGTDVQAYDSTLTAFAAYNTNGILTQTAADTFTGRTLTGTANQITVTNGDGVAGNPTLTVPYNFNLGSSATAQSSIAFFEDTDNGSNKITLTTPAAIAADYTFTLPPDVGTVDYVLRTDGAGVTTWVAQAGGSTNLGLTTLVANGLIST